MRDKSFYRAIRSLRSMGRIDDYTVDRGPGPGLSGRARYIAIVPVYEVGGRLRFAREADRELAALADEAQRQVRTLAAARGVRLEPASKGPLEGTSVDAYRRLSNIKRLNDYRRSTATGGEASNDARASGIVCLYHALPGTSRTAMLQASCASSIPLI